MSFKSNLQQKHILKRHETTVFLLLINLSLFPSCPFSPGLLTGRNLRWQRLQHQQSSCRPAEERLVPGEEERAAESAKHAYGRSVENATSAKT